MPSFIFSFKKAVKLLVENAKKSMDINEDAFLPELIHFCEWVGYEEDTAYIFLLRDTLLPYIYYQGKDRDNIYPWLLGRKTLATLTDNECVDDEIRASIIKALEFGDCRNYVEKCHNKEVEKYTFAEVKAILA